MLMKNGRSNSCGTLPDSKHDSSSNAIVMRPVTGIPRYFGYLMPGGGNIAVVDRHAFDVDTVHHVYASMLRVRCSKLT